VVATSLRKLQKNTTGHRNWEIFTVKFKMENVKITSMMRNNIFKDSIFQMVKQFLVFLGIKYPLLYSQTLQLNLKKIKVTF
jgi:hypothetical protein